MEVGSGVSTYSGDRTYTPQGGAGSIRDYAEVGEEPVANAEGVTSMGAAPRRGVVPCSTTPCLSFQLLEPV